MDLNQHSKLLHCQPAKLFEHDLTAAAAALHEAIHASVPQLEAPGFTKAIKRQQAAAAALRKAIVPPSVPQLEAPGFTKAIERQQAAVAALRKAMVPSPVPQPGAPGLVKSIKREDDPTKECRRSNLSDTGGLIQAVENLASAFRNGDFKGCFENILVALQILVKLIAQARFSSPAEIFNFLSEAVACLQKSGYITKRQERWIRWAAALLFLFSIFL